MQLATTTHAIRFSCEIAVVVLILGELTNFARVMSRARNRLIYIAKRPLEILDFGSALFVIYYRIVFLLSSERVGFRLRDAAGLESNYCDLWSLQKGVWVSQY